MGILLGVWRRYGATLRVAVILVGAVAFLTGCMSTGHEPVTVVRPVWPEPDSAPVVESTPSIWPLQCEDRIITSHFGYRRSLGGGGQRLHRGVDIAAPRETPILATAPGRVIRAEGRNTGGYGNLVVVKHSDKYESWYAHLNSFRVRTGDVVDRGDVLGGVGRTGRATGYHLHYEVRILGEAVDPIKYLGE